MKEQNVDPHLAELAAKYAAAAQKAYACETNNTDPNAGFQFTAGGLRVQVYRVEPDPDADPPNDWYEWRILDATGAKVAKNAGDDHAIFSDLAVAEAWLQFTRLTPANEDWGSDAEAEALYEAARRAAA